MKEQWQQDIWEDFFSDPRLKSIIEEAGGEMMDSDGEPNMDGSGEGEEPEGEAGGSGIDIEQLAADFAEGGLEQEDLVKLYQSGKITKEEIQQIISSVEGEEPQSEEELLGQQIDQTNDTFVKFALYDKIIELLEKLDYFKENFDDTRSGIYERVLQLSEFLNILSNLLFSLETSVSYQMYGSILLQLTELFAEYNQSQEAEDAQEDREDEQEDEEEKEKLQRQFNTSEDGLKSPENPENSQERSGQDHSINDIKQYSA